MKEYSQKYGGSNGTFFNYDQARAKRNSRAIKRNRKGLEELQKESEKLNTSSKANTEQLEKQAIASVKYQAEIDLDSALLDLDMARAELGLMVGEYEY